MLYDLISLSDRYTFQADSLECAALVTCVLGRGQYGANNLTDEERPGVPIFLFGGAEKWFMANFGRTISESFAFFKNYHKASLVEAFRSVVIGNRKEYEEAIKFIPEDKQEEWKALRHERLRSSMNDIGRRAHAFADALCLPSKQHQ